MRAHGTREYLGRFVSGAANDPMPKAPGAVFVGPVARRRWLPALLALASATSTRFHRQKKV